MKRCFSQQEQKQSFEILCVSLTPADVKISAKQKLGGDGRRSVRPGVAVPEPVNEWSLREKLALASAVQQSGDQNWGTVSRSIKGFAERPRPSDWFSQKNCAVQYNKLLETYEPPKRKRGEQETAVHAIVKNLTAQYIAFLDRVIPLGNAKYEKKLNKIKDLETGRISDERVGQMYDKFMKSRVRPVEVFEDDDEYTDIDDDDLDDDDVGHSEAATSSVLRASAEVPSTSNANKTEVPIEMETEIQLTGQEAKPSNLDSSKATGTGSPLISAELKHLVHTAIAGTDEKERSRAGVPAGSPTLSMLLELPPRGHGQPLPQLPVLQEPTKIADVLSGVGVSQVSTSSESNRIQNQFFSAIPTIDKNSGTASETLSGNPLYPAVPEDFLCLAGDESSSKPTDLELQLKKEELFQSSSVPVEDSESKDSSTLAFDSIPSSSFSSSEAFAAKQEHFLTEKTAKPESKVSIEKEHAQLAPLELSELDFQDDAELSVPPPPFRHNTTLSTVSLLNDDSAIQTVHTTPAKAVYPPPLKSVYSTPLKTLQFSPTKSTRSSPTSSRPPESPSQKEEVKSSATRARRQLTPTLGLGKTSPIEPDIISTETESESTTTEDEDTKVNLPNLRSRRSAASTPVPFTPEASSESPAKLAPTELRVEVIEDFSEEAEFVSRVEDNSDSSKSVSEHDPLASTDKKANDVNIDIDDGKLDISTESEVFYDAVTEIKETSDNTETVSEIVALEITPSVSVKNESKTELETGSAKSKDTKELPEDQNTEQTTRLRQGSDDDFESSSNRRLLEIESLLKSKLPDGTPLIQTDEQKRDTDSSWQSDEIEDLREEYQNIKENLELRAQSKLKQAGKEDQSGTEAAPENEQGDSASTRPLRALRSRQSMPLTPSVVEIPNEGIASISTIPEVTEQFTAEQRKEKRRVKKQMLDLIAKVMNIPDIGEFTRKLEESSKKEKASHVKEDVDLVTLKLRVEANGLDSYEELIRCLNLMFYNHVVVKGREDRDLVKRVANDFWALLEEDSTSTETPNLAEVNILPAPEIDVSTPVTSRSRLSSTSSTASARRSKSEKKKEESLPARELRKSGFQKPTDTPSSSSRIRKSESSDRAASPPLTDEKSKSGGGSKRKRGGTRVSTPEPESPSPPPEETKKLRSRQSQGGRASTPVLPQKKTSTPSIRGKRNRAT